MASVGSPWTANDRRRPKVGASASIDRRSVDSRAAAAIDRRSGPAMGAPSDGGLQALPARVRDGDDADASEGSGEPECAPRSRVTAPTTSGRGALCEVGYLVAACAAGTVEQATVGVHPLGVAEQVEQDVGRPVAARASER